MLSSAELLEVLNAVFQQSGDLACEREHIHHTIGQDGHRPVPSNTVASSIIILCHMYYTLHKPRYAPGELTAPTIPGLPRRSSTPFFKSRLASMSAALMPRSLSTKAWRIVPTSRYRLP